MDNLNLSILEYTDKVLKKEKKNKVSDSEKSYAVAMFTILSIQKIWISEFLQKNGLDRFLSVINKRRCPPKKEEKRRWYMNVSIVTTILTIRRNILDTVPHVNIET